MKSALDSIAPLTQARSASERVADRLRDLIRSGNIRPGERLPSEHELAGALQVSRPVVREALRGLAMMGVVETRRGGGCFVTDLTPGRLMEPLSSFLELSEHSLSELFEARRHIDGGVAEQAAIHAAPDQIEAMKGMVAQGYELTGDPVGFRVMDAEFHELISDAGRNDFLHRMSQALYRLALDRRRAASAIPGVLAQSARDHDAIVAAIASGDAETAGKAMRRHVDHIRDTTFAVAADMAMSPARPGKD